MWSLLLVLLSISAIGCSRPASMTPRANARDEIAAYVNRAANLVKSQGVACNTLSNRAWNSGDWYIFVIDVEGLIVGLPVEPEMKGTSASEVVDVNGKRFVAEFLRTASAGGGWVDFMGPRPGETTPVPKSAYVRKVTAPDGKTYVIGSGGYGVK